MRILKALWPTSVIHNVCRHARAMILPESMELFLIFNYTIILNSRPVLNSIFWILLAIYFFQSNIYVDIFRKWFSTGIDVHYKVKLYLQIYLHFTKYEWKKWYWIILWAIGLSLDNRVKFPHKAPYFFPEVLAWPKSSFGIFITSSQRTWMKFWPAQYYILLEMYLTISPSTQSPNL